MVHAEEFIREAYKPCFEEVETIVVFYLSDYSKEADLTDNSLYIITLYPLHDFEDSFSNKLLGGNDNRIEGQTLLLK